ncbi:hypothetical protein [Treponema phagedenis]|nr:hypothetical protein [Treponema phagedenis]
MKTDARVEIVHYKNNELTVRIIGDSVLVKVKTPYLTSILFAQCL